DRAHVVAHRCGDVHQVGGLGPHRELFHVAYPGGVEHGVAGSHLDHRDRVRNTDRGHSGAVDRSEHHVPPVTTTGTDALAAVQHVRVVLLALPDDHGSVHRHGADHVPHAAYGGIVRTVLVALAHPAGRRQRGRLRDTDQFQREVAVGLGGGAGLRHGHGAFLQEEQGEIQYTG